MRTMLPALPDIDAWRFASHMKASGLGSSAARLDGAWRRRGAMSQVGLRQKDRSMPNEEHPPDQHAILFGTFRLRVAQRLLENDGAPVHLGPRTLDILIALVERAGDAVSKQDLMARVWPDTTVDEGSLRFQVALLRKVLGEDGPDARYVTTLPGRGYCFVAPISHGSAPELPAAESPVAHPSYGLPARLTRMVGRDETVQRLSAQLASERFVTIVGPGGIGKTTVAVAAAHTLLADFAGAVCFFDLGPLSDPLLVASAVASTLGLQVPARDPTPGLIAFLRDKRMLLILDSCEHVVETAALLAERIFQEAPQTYILATSREALRVEGEHVHPLTPLDSPPEDSGLTAAQVLAFPAARLFVERVAASGHRFELQDSDAPTVAEICRRLDGIALAIELAAGRVNAYGIQETAALLNDRFRLLWKGRRTALLRHQTMSAALDWSYDLLRDAERDVLRRLSVFLGVFTLEAARSVAMGDDIDGEQVVATLASLVEKSLVAANTSEVTTRYRLLDTTRAYVLGKLIDSGDADRAARHHAVYYLALLERTDTTTASTTPDARTFADFGEHLGNVRAALEWSFFERGDLAVGVALAAASARLFLEMSLLTECHRWTEQAIAVLDNSTRGTRREMELQAALGLALMFTRGNSEQAGDALKRGLVLAGELGDLHNELRLLGRLHIFHERIGDFHSALEFALRGEVVAARIADPVGIAEAHSALGISRHLEGSGARARFHLEAATAELPVSPRINTFHFGFDYRNRARITLARVLWLEGLPDQAVVVARQTIAEAETFDHPVTLCIALIWAVQVFLWNGDLDVAEAHIDRFIEQADRYSLAPYQAVGRGVKGELLVRRGQPEAGITELRAALETLRPLRHELLTNSFSTTIAEGLAMMGRLDAARGAIDEVIALIGRRGDLFVIPELLRVKGTILASAREPEPAKAEQCFLESLDLSSRQGALAWQLRTATSLAVLRVAQGRPAEARAVLAPIYDRFTEGFGNADLNAAERLLRTSIDL
jgi:predicted ATPase/DNA-binding winged helix-turn-helix (wHTH) protein